MNARFHFFVDVFSDDSKSSEGESEQTTSSRLKTWRMSEGFTLNLSVVAFSCRLVILTIGSLSRCLLLKMLFNSDESI